MRERKRSKDRKRSRERNRKKSIIENLSSVLSTLSTQESDERCESMPPLSPAYKVRTVVDMSFCYVSIYFYVYLFFYYLM